jgi:hypothetical protein
MLLVEELFALLFVVLCLATAFSGIVVFNFVEDVCTIRRRHVSDDVRATANILMCSCCCFVTLGIKTLAKSILYCELF